MPKYEPSPLDESRTRFSADAAAVKKQVNRKFVFVTIVGVFIALAVVLLIVLLG